MFETMRQVRTVDGRRGVEKAEGVSSRHTNGGGAVCGTLKVRSERRARERGRTAGLQDLVDRLLVFVNCFSTSPSLCLATPPFLLLATFYLVLSPLPRTSPLPLLHLDRPIKCASPSSWRPSSLARSALAHSSLPRWMKSELPCSNRVRCRGEGGRTRSAPGGVERGEKGRRPVLWIASRAAQKANQSVCRCS